MTRVNTAIFIFVIALFTSSGVAQSADTVEEIRACAGMADQSARLACYDNLGERVLREDPAAIEPPHEEDVQPEPVTETATIVEPLPDDLGKAKTVQYGGLITSCKKSGSGTWYFFFDNGQVWKDVDSRRLRFKECNFSATITKDAFGYKMRIDEVDKTIRVRRNR